VHGVRTAVAAGCRTVVLTNAAGSIRPDVPIGTPTLIADHLDLTARAPGLDAAPQTDERGAAGAGAATARAEAATDPPDGGGATSAARSGPGLGTATGPAWLAGAGNATAGMGGAAGGRPAVYSARLRALAQEVDPGLPTAVYAGLVGPHFETPAEIRALRVLGADLVGMSTVLEATAAYSAGAEVLGISLVSNLAAGVSPAPLSGEDVLAAGHAAQPRLAALLSGVLDRLDTGRPRAAP
jgi:purine nucleoside phosphorylase